jgi:hypothetical protein
MFSTNTIRTKILLIFILFSTVYASSQKADDDKKEEEDTEICDGTAKLKWSKTFVEIRHGNLYDDNYPNFTIASDESGNAYMAVQINNNISTEPNKGELDITGNGIVVNKLDTAGKLLWAKQFLTNNSRYDTINLKIDAKQNAYMSFSSDQSGTTTTAILSADGKIIYNNVSNYRSAIIDIDNNGNMYRVYRGNRIQKVNKNGVVYDKENCTGYDYGGINDIKVNSIGEIFISGCVRNTDTDFDSGPGIVHLTAPQPDPISSDYLFYLQKLNAAGNLLWVKKIGLFQQLSSKLFIDKSNNLIATNYGNGFHLYLTKKFNKDGNLLWEKQTRRGDAVATDALENIYIINGGKLQKLTPDGLVIWEIPANAHKFAFANNKHLYTIDYQYDNEKRRYTVSKYSMCND